MSDIDAAVAFLARWYDTSPRQLVSIVPDGSISAKCLWPQQPDDERDWLRKAVAGKRNIYFHVNQPGWAQDKKAEKADIRTVRALHVDIDPRADETPTACKKRAGKALADFVPPPSVVIDSGNGLQAFWLLDEPITLDGTPEASAKIEAYNMGLEVALGADSCHNIDRIMRVPGTVNLPNKKKLAKGRVEVESKLLDVSTWTLYPLSDFLPAKPVQQPGTSRRGRVEVPGNLPRFASTDDLPGNINDYTKMLIVNGQDVENPTKYPSRSEVLWRVLCDMVRGNCDDETIAAVILDPDFKISSSVLDKSRPQAYAADQIAAAREEAINPGLRELNGRHAVIESDRGGRCVIAEEDYDELMGRWHIKYQSFDAFRNRYMHRMISVGKDKNENPILVPLGKWWLMQEHRRQYRKIVFWPNRDVPPDQYNLWRGFACEARPGDGHLGFIDHVLQHICGGDSVLCDYVLNWMARAVQQPDRPGEVALVVRGRKGTGKGFLGRTFGSLFGQHYMQVASAKYVIGEFNAHLRDCVVLFCDEAFFAGDKKHESILKSLITEPHLTIEAKGIDAEPAPNFLHLIVASNEDWVIPASADERRYVVCEASDDRRQDTAYFKELQRQMDSGGRENLLHYLMRRDLAEYEVRKPPRTQGLDDQKSLSQRAEEAWWYHKLQEGRLMATHSRFENKVTKDGMYDDYVDEMIRQGNQRRLSRIALGKYVTKMCPRGWPKQEQAYMTLPAVSSRGERHDRKVRPWFYVFPPLDELRSEFTAVVGRIDDWPDPSGGDDTHPDPGTEVPF